MILKFVYINIVNNQYINMDYALCVNNLKK